MEAVVAASKAVLPSRHVTPGLKFAQWWLGLGATLALALPYLRRTRGKERLDPKQRYLFVSNHVSLLDTILLGGLCWRFNCYPILVLGDKSVWHASALKKLLSRKIGFLLDRGRMNPKRIEELEEFGRAGQEFHLLVFPEGTRGDGVNVAACQPGIHYIAQSARIPIVPVFISNMQLISTKHGPFRPFAGWRKVEVNFGEVLPPESYLGLEREELTAYIRERIAATKTLT